MIPLDVYLKQTIAKRQFFGLVSDILNVFKKTQEAYLYHKNLLLATNHILLDPATKKVRFIYLPIQNLDNAVLYKDFFLNLVYSSVFSRLDDTAYVKDYVAFFKKNGQFSFFEFEEFIKKMSANNPAAMKTVAKIQDERVCAKCGYKNASPNAYYCGSCGAPILAEQKKADEKTYNPSEIIAEMRDRKITGQPSVPEKLFEDKPVKKANTQGFSGTTVLGEDDSFGTTVLSDEELNASSYPCLIRKKTDEKIVLDKPVFRIGKEKSYVDYFVSDNGAVSRSHADFIMKNGLYYVQDKNSTNKTYINGKAIPANVEVEIRDGQIIRLANEEFEFKL